MLGLFLFLLADMKTFTKTFALILLIALFACKSNEPKPVVYKINSAKVDCVGVAPMTCLQIQKGENIDTENWEMFYASIEGFNYEPGYIYSISVKETELAEDEVPADGSSIKFELVEVLEKSQDPLLALHDIYIVQEILGTAIQGDSLTKVPTMEIFVSERRIAGTDGCNNYFASIENLTETEITFSQAGATRMLCPDMTTPALFNKALNEVKAYKRGNGNVMLTNASGETVILLKKID
jgi:heat shock protein HslJ